MMRRRRVAAIVFHPKSAASCDAMYIKPDATSIRTGCRPSVASRAANRPAAKRWRRQRAAFRRLHRDGIRHFLERRDLVEFHIARDRHRHSVSSLLCLGTACWQRYAQWPVRSHCCRLALTWPGDSCVPLCGVPHKGTYADLSIMWNGMGASRSKGCCEAFFRY